MKTINFMIFSIIFTTFTNMASANNDYNFVNNKLLKNCNTYLQNNQNKPIPFESSCYGFIKTVYKLNIIQKRRVNSFQITNNTKQRKYYDFYKNKNLIDKAHNIAAGIAGKCATLEMDKMISTGGFWQKTFIQVINEEGPVFLISWFDNHLEKYSPETYSLVQRDKQLQVYKKYYYDANKKVKPSDCIDKKTSVSYSEIKKYQGLAKINAKFTFGILYDIDKERTSIYINYFKSKMPTIYEYLGIL